MKEIRIDKNENIGILFPQLFYTKYLTSIEKITFTSREIDIIACILSGRLVKKIASFLQISPRTVETHIRNILLKINGQSQGSIIDFVEHSEKFNLIRKYYSNLLIYSFFVEELKRISKESKQQNPICLIIQDSEIDKSFIVQTESMLALTGIKIQKKYSHNKNIDLFLKNEEFAHFNIFLIYLSSSPSSVISEQERDTFKIYSKKNEKDLEIESISMKEHNNHYFLIFDILKKIFSEQEIKNSFIKFKYKHDTVVDSSFQYSLAKNKLHSEKSNENNNYMITDNHNNSHRDNYNDDVKDLNIVNSKHLRPHKFPLINRRIQLFFGSLIISSFLILYLYSHFLGINNGDIAKNQKSVGRFPSNITSLGSNKPSTSLAKKIEAGKFITWNLPRQDNKFIGRKDILLKIERALQAAESTQENKITSAIKNFAKYFENDSVINPVRNSVLVTVCAGLGGVGKTQLALQYIHHSKYPYNLRAWFYSENKESLKTQYIDFSKKLGLKEKDPTFETACDYVKEWLTEHPGWLLVYDNVTNYEDIKDFLPYKGGDIILTTRNRSWPTTFETFDIEVMSESESIELITSLVKHFRNNSDQEKNEIKELVKKLGNLPLALSQAGAYIDQSSLSFADYLNLYKTHEQELLRDNSKPEGTNSLPIATTWNISLEAIAKENEALNQSPSALEILMICAYLEPSKIPRLILETWFRENYPKESIILLPKLISQLHRYSMISINDDESITVHRLVQSVLRQQHMESPNQLTPYLKNLNIQWYNKLLKTFDKVFWMENDNLISEKKIQLQLLPHLEALIQYFNSAWPNLDSIEYGNISYDIAHVLRHHLGELRASKIHYDKALLIHRNHNPKDNIDIAEILAALGSLYWDIGDNNVAKKLLLRALNIIEEHEIGYSLVKIRIMHELASVANRSGDFENAKKLLESALSLSDQRATTNIERVNTERIFIFTKLGQMYKMLGNTKKAKENLLRSIEIGQQQYGSDHQWLFHSFYHLAHTYIVEGNYIEAQKMFESLLKFREEHYGKNHRWVGTVLNCLGYTYAKLGNIKGGLALQNRSLEILNRTSGPLHGNTGFTLKYLGETYLELRNFEKAKNFLELALNIAEKYYHRNDIEVAFILVCLGDLYLQLNDLKKAKEILDRALRIEEMFLIKNNPEIAKAHLVLAKIYIKNNQLELAKPIVSNCYQIFLKEYGENSYFTKQALSIHKSIPY